jgi:hypothetical protein
MKVFFNTGRLYTKEGQVISAEWDGKGNILFCDHSRGIGGTITTSNYNWDEYHLAKAIMAAYDHGLYLHTLAGMNMKRPEGEPKRIQL